MSGKYYVFKLLLAGQGGVGKTALVERFCNGHFQDDYKMTIGSGTYTKDVLLDGNINVKLQIWDFAGEDRFRFILKEYARGAAGALCCFDITDYDTLTAIPEWIKLIREGSRPDVPLMLVGTKYDLPEHEIEFDAVAKYAEDAKCTGGAVFCSAKTGDNVEEIFTEIARVMYKIASS